MPRAVLPWLLAALGYLALACALTWPLALQLDSALPGFPNVDALDTLSLRGLVAQMLLSPSEWPHSQGVYYPAGYPVGQLTPNLLDHVLGAPFVWALPFPLSDSLWWLLLLAANGLAAHRLGWQEGGSHGAGLLAGVAFAASEPVLREANLLHAPQALLPWAPLYLAALLRLSRETGRWRDGAMAGLWMGLAGLSYWYLPLFLALGSVPLGLTMLRRRAALQRVALAAAVSLLVVAPLLLPLLSGWEQLPLADMSQAPAPLEMRDALEPIPEARRFVVEQSAPLPWPFAAAPLDRSNRLPWVLLLAAGLVLVTRRPREALPLLGLSALGAVMILGPYLKWGEDPLLWGGQPLSLPCQWLASLHPFFERLTWPQRWGLLIPLGLLPLAARAPRPALWAPFALLEAIALSGNAPLQMQDLRGQAPWAQLAQAQGAIVELPLAREGLDAPIVGLHARYHGQPVVNPMLLPPGAELPHAWRRWMAEAPLMAYLETFEAGTWPPDPGAEAVRAAQEAGVAAIVVDATPNGVLTEGRQLRYLSGLRKHLGEPQDLGALYVWWLIPPAGPVAAPEDPEAWRRREKIRQLDAERPELETLIEPLW
ncbi:MAG: hypothetical protein H6741_03140 [Alphaproteobacteria bacterium]|nr:hypothetical protein [Alphaproteobacteria bacterium]